VKLVRALDDYLETSGGGHVYHAPFDVVLSNHDVVEPDLLVVLNNQLEVLTPQHVRGAPAIVVEILSPGTRRRDETLKRNLYARAGVREYWMVDPEAQAITVCRQLDSPRFDRATKFEAAAGDTLTSAHLPGFSMALERLFQEPPARQP
jgi:Uma2 family endonuclease